MTFMTRCMFFVLIGSAIGGQSNADESMPVQWGITPIPEAQATFPDLMTLILDTPYNATTKKLHDEKVASLIQFVDGNKVALLQQWMYCYASYVSKLELGRRSDVATAMQGLWVAFDVDFEDVAYAFYPLLEESDEKFRELLIPFVVRGTPQGSIDFGVYESILREELEQRGDVPVGLLRYMYAKKPGIAPLTIMGLDDPIFHGLKRELKIEKGDKNWPVPVYKELALPTYVSKAVVTQELEKLSQRPEWWVQLFVAEFAAQIPDASNEAILNNLSKSACPLVVEVLSDLVKHLTKTTK